MRSPVFSLPSPSFAGDLLLVSSRHTAKRSGYDDPAGKTSVLVLVQLGRTVIFAAVPPKASMQVPSVVLKAALTV